jgi:hypothetical protein
VAAKIEAGSWLLDKLQSRQPGVAWALGRLGARVPVAGAAQSVVPKETASQWLSALLGQVDLAEAQFAIAQIARRSGDRARDLDEEDGILAASALEKRAAPPDWARAVREVQALGEKDEQRVFGESLPLGLHLAG